MTKEALTQIQNQPVVGGRKQEEEQTGEGLQSVNPLQNRTMEAKLNSRKMTNNSIFSSRFPGRQVGRFIIENVIITLLPEASSTNQKGLHEERIPKVVPGNINLVMNVETIIPNNSNSKLAALGRGAL